ncbi:Bifunctional apoptosis regulator [Symbiodinium microadriaticum]|uniref:Bifunctional apoptosis regulator n=2 Tax=Symbiodinium TaxID=2949 RepID=A0A1Q9DPS3_SYMMI|nr:Bifunctional apoptosis regulator [Symbiodinium microadriaticum]
MVLGMVTVVSDDNDDGNGDGGGDDDDDDDDNIRRDDDDVVTALLGWMSIQPSKASTISAEEFTCAICISSPLVDPVTTPCGHSFDKACYESYLHSSALRSGRRECPLCKKPVSTKCPEVSVLLRDAITRLFPEGRRRCEGEMFEELEAGVVRSETFDFLLTRLRAAGQCEDTGSLLQLLSLFITAMTREPSELATRGRVTEVSIQRAFQELSKTLLELLSQEPADNAGYGTLLEVLQQAVETLAQHWSDQISSVFPTREQFAQQVGSLASQAAAMLPQRQEGSLLRLTALVLEAAVMGLAGIRWQLDMEQSSQISKCLLGVLVINASDEAEYSVNIVCLRTFGSLATIVQSLDEAVWCEARDKLQDALCQEENIELAATAAQACGAVLDTKLCPPQHLTRWLKSLMLGSQGWLSTSSAIQNPPCARRLLSLLGDVHRFAPSVASAKEDLKDLLGEGRYDITCGLIITAGRHASGDRDLKLGVMEAWEGVLALAQGLPQGDASDAFRNLVPHVISVIIMNLMADEEDFVSAARALLGDLLQLALGGWPLRAMICGAWQQEPDAKRALRKACGMELLIRQDFHHRIEHLARQLTLSLEQETSKTAAAAMFGGMARPAPRKPRAPGNWSPVQRPA